MERIDTKRLRAKLLDLAVRGKLVPQDPNDEPASVLLERIRAERAELVRQKKAKAPKGGDSVIYRGSDGSRYEKRGKSEPVCIDEEVPFELPEGWEWTRLNNLALAYGGKTPSKSVKEFWENGTVPWTTSKDVKADRLYGSQMCITERAAEDMNIVPPESVILVTRSGILRRLLPVAVNALPTTVNQDLKAMVPFDVALTPWLFIAIKGQDDWIRSTYHKDGTTVDSIDFDRMFGMLVPVPPIEEQARIAVVLKLELSFVDEIERSQSDLDTLYAQLRSKILDLAVRGQLVEQNSNDEPANELLARIRQERKALVAAGKAKATKGGDSVIYRASDGGHYEKRGKKTECIEVPYDLPEGWAWTRLSTITYPIGTKDRQIALKDALDEGKFPVITQGEAFIDGYSDDETKAITDLPIVLFGDHTRNVKLIEAPFIVGADGTKLHKCILVDPRYLAFWMQNAAEKIRNRGYARHYAELNDRPIALPPLAEQRRIVERVNQTLSFLA